MSDAEEYEEGYLDEEDAQHEEGEEHEELEGEDEDEADPETQQDEGVDGAIEAALPVEDDNEPPLVLEKEWLGYVRVSVPASFAVPPTLAEAPTDGDTTMPAPLDETATGGSEGVSPRPGDDDGEEDEEGGLVEEREEVEEREYAAAPKVPFASMVHPPLREARIYFTVESKADRTTPPWMRYLLNNEPHFFDTVMAGKKVERPEDRARAIALKKKLAALAAKKAKAAAKRKKKNKGAVEEEEEEVAPPEPKEETQYDDDGHVVIPHPFDGNARFRLVQLLKGRPANPRLNLPEITVEEGGDLVFIATLMEPTEVEAEEAAWEADGPASLMPAPTGRAAAILPPEVVRSVHKSNPPRNLANLARTPQPDDEAAARDEERPEGSDEEDERVKSSMSRGDEVDEEQAEVEEDEEAGDEPAELPLELRMDVMTLAALFCPRAFERGLMKHEALPNMALTTAWLEIYMDALEGTEAMPEEFNTMKANIAEGAAKALAAKKTPTGKKTEQEDAEGGEEEKPEGEEAHVDAPPPAAPYAVRGDDGLFTVPKPKMDLSWTFIKEAHFPALRDELRALRRVLCPEVLPPMPVSPTPICTTPQMVLSYLDFLMHIPRSALASWTKTKLEDPEDDIEDAADIALDPTSEEHQERPLSYMLGNVLLDIRRREARKRRGKKDMRLGMFAAHKAALTAKFVESNTVLDPLVTARHAVNVVAEEAEAQAAARHLSVKSEFLSSWKGAAEGESSVHAPATEWDDVPSFWPVSLRLYDSDLVALACGRYGALETFQEVLRIKAERREPRLVDDTVGTYHLLLQLLPELAASCSQYLLHYAANCVPVIPILTARSTITSFDLLDTLAAIDPESTETETTTIEGVSCRSTSLCLQIAQQFYQRWSSDSLFLDSLQARAPSVHRYVCCEIDKFHRLLSGVENGDISPEQLDAWVLTADGVDTGDCLPSRDIYSPRVMYAAIRGRNTAVIVHLATRHDVITAQECYGASTTPLTALLIEDDERRTNEAAAKPLEARTTEDLLISPEDRADGVLSILLALVDGGMPLTKEVFQSGVKGYVAALQDSYGKSKKLTQLIKRLTLREHERGTDPNRKYGILRNVPEQPRLAASPSRRVALKYVAAPTDE